MTTHTPSSTHPSPQRICYQVVATLPDEPTAHEYIAWLQDGHVDQVLAAGAHSALMVRLDPELPATHPRVMTQYIFSTRDTFDRYIALHAPALRADGLSRFPPARGITFARHQGVVL